MNLTHLHLIITHLPVFASISGAVLLIYGLWMKSGSAKITAYVFLIVASLSAIIAYLTGEAAEETVENLAGISKNVIEDHEESATSTLISSILLGVISLPGVFLTLKKSAYARGCAYAALLVGSATFLLASRTGYLGGKIRHTEIHTVQPVQKEQMHGESDD